MLPQVLYEGLVMGLIYALLAMGIALIWGVCGILSFCQGEFMLIAMYMTYGLYEYCGLDPIQSIPIVMVAMFFVGVLVFKTIIKQAMKGPVLVQRLVTFALSLVIINGVLMTIGSRVRSITNLMLSGNINLGIISVSYQKLVPMAVSVLVTVFLFLFLNKTQTGMAIRATSQDKEAAGLMGINTERMQTLAFAVSSAIAGAAGCALTYFYFVSPTVSSPFQIFGFMAVCIGGLGSIGGAFLGGLLVGIVDLLGGTYLSVAYKYVIIAVMYLAVVSIKPQGIFKR